MFTAISLFFKEKVFTLTGTFIIIFASIFAIFLIFNSNVILSKFGFETTTTLKSELTKSQKDLERLADINRSNMDTLDTVTKTHKKEVELIETYIKDKDIVTSKVTKIISDRKTESKPIETIVNEKITVTDTTIVLPLEEYNKLSEKNIEALHKAYEEFLLG